MVGVYSQKQYDERRESAKAGTYVAKLKDSAKEICIVGFWQTQAGIIPLTELMPANSVASFQERYPDALIHENIGECLSVHRYADVENFSTRDALLAFSARHVSPTRVSTNEPKFS